MLRTSEKVPLRILWWAALVLGLSLSLAPHQIFAAVTTTTVQDTVYRADGGIANGTLIVSWPAFSTPDNGAVAAGTLTVGIGADGFVSLKLAPNEGATPAGTYYTAVYHLSDGTVSKEYWLVPQTTTATIAAIRTQVVPAAVAMQSATKQYVDTVLYQLSGSYLPLSGGTVTGPLTLPGDPAAAAQAATKHYVDTAVGGINANAVGAVPLAGGSMTGPLILNSDPAQAAQAATKSYVDAQVKNAGGAGPDAATIASVNARVAKMGDTMTGPLNAPQVNHIIYADQYPTVQAAMTAACQASPAQSVIIPASVPVPPEFSPQEFTNTCNTQVVDERTGHQDIWYARSFGAVCNNTNDTAAVQAAINAAAAASTVLNGLHIVQLPSGNCSFNVYVPTGVMVQGQEGGTTGTTFVSNANRGQSPIFSMYGSNSGVRNMTLAGAGSGQFQSVSNAVRSQGTVTLTFPNAVPDSLQTGSQINSAGSSDPAFNGIATITAVGTNSISYNNAKRVTGCTFSAPGANQTATCNTSNAGGAWLGQSFKAGGSVTVTSGSGANAFTATGPITSLGSGNFPDTSDKFPTTVNFKVVSSSGTFSTQSAVLYPSDNVIALGQISGLKYGCGYCISTITGESRSGNVLTLTLATGSGGWPGNPGIDRLDVAGSSDPSINGTWTVAATPNVGGGQLYLTNPGPDVIHSTGTVGLMADKGIFVPNANNVIIEKVTGSNFGEGFIDWESGERLLVNLAQASSCLLDVNRHQLVPLPVNGPGFDVYPAQNPMGCVVMNGTDGYMQFSEISTGSWNPFGDPNQTSVVDATLPSKAIVVGFGGIDTWMDSDIGEISDQGLWNGSEFSRFYENRFDLNAGSGLENDGNENVFIGNTVLHDNRDHVINPGGWYGIDESGAWGGVAGGNIWSANHALSSNGKCDIHDGLSSASAPPNQWQGNQGSVCTADGYTGAFSFGEADFAAETVSSGNNGQAYVGGRRNWRLSSGGGTVGVNNFASGVNGQSVSVITDGNIQYSGAAGGYGIRTCSAYPYVPVSGWGTTNFTLQGEYVKVWQENCDQVAGFQIEPHFALNLKAVTPPGTAVNLSGATGSSTYVYECVNVTRQGTETTGTASAITNGPAALSQNNNIHVYCSNNDPGAYYQRIYRTQAPAGSGLQIGLVAFTNNWTDTGSPIINATLPSASDHTADISTPGNLTVTGTTTLNSLVITGGCTGCGGGSGGGGSATVLQTNGVSNAVQGLLNLQAGNGVTVSNSSGGNVSVAWAPADSNFGYTDTPNSWTQAQTFSQAKMGNWFFGPNATNPDALYFFDNSATNAHTMFSVTANGFQFGAGDLFAWSNNGNADLGSLDVGFSRLGPGAVACGNGGHGDRSCTLAVGAITTIAATPVSSSVTCTAGAIWADDAYLYHCSSGGNSVKRVALGSF